MEITLSLPSYHSLWKASAGLPTVATRLPRPDGYGIEERIALHPQRTARTTCSEFMEELRTRGA